MEETHERPGLTIERAHVATLPCIASKAGAREVFDFPDEAWLATSEVGIRAMIQ